MCEMAEMDSYSVNLCGLLFRLIPFHSPLNVLLIFHQHFFIYTVKILSVQRWCIEPYCWAFFHNLRLSEVGYHNVCLSWQQFRFKWYFYFLETLVHERFMQMVSNFHTDVWLWHSCRGGWGSSFSSFLCMKVTSGIPVI